MVDGKYDCMDTGCVYRVNCELCKDADTSGDLRDHGLYIGQSGRSLHARQLDHSRGISSNKDTCPMVRHFKDQHRDLKPELNHFKMTRIMKSKDNMSRLLGEAENIQLEMKKGTKLWNSKAEFGKNRVVRWTAQVEQM